MPASLSPARRHTAQRGPFIDDITLTELIETTPPEARSICSHRAPVNQLLFEARIGADCPCYRPQDGDAQDAVEVLAAILHRAFELGGVERVRSMLTKYHHDILCQATACGYTTD